ncbi:MAG: DEAD/DEAH box helicase [Desulfovibrio sp.]|uniref:DEAD/DEAH box helicase n=1 Tax=Desulfovibrio sp. 7SRBS1 TaxID=3378064 RepID=UPI003B3EB410
MTDQEISTTDSGRDVSSDASDMPEKELLPEAVFSELPESIREASVRAGWNDLMPVQAKAMPYLLEGKDLMVQSRTGSGKTGAFLLPALYRIDPDDPVCQVLILVPTRELAKQVAHEARVLSKDTGIHVVEVYGGVGYKQQTDAFREGAHLVVGTPGRILDHLMNINLRLDGLHTLIFDEADRMLSIGFYPDMKQIQRYMPDYKPATFMFSATYPPSVKRLGGEFMHDHEFLSLSSDMVYVASTHHTYVNVPRMEKDRALIRLIEMDNPESAIIFCNTKATVEYLATVLQNFGYDAEAITADLRQNKREQILGRSREGKLRLLVATDLAARGIDIPNLSHVYIYEPPDDHEIYIHRAGRTGRAGAAGNATSLVDTMEKVTLDRIAQQYSINIEECALPTDEDVEKVVSERLIALIESKMRSVTGLRSERMLRFVKLAHELSQTEDEMHLLTMLLDEYYQQSLHAAPPAPPLEDSRPAPYKSGGKGRGDGGRKPRQSSGPKGGPKSSGPKPGPKGGPKSSGQNSGQSDGDAQRKRRRRRKPSGE